MNKKLNFILFWTPRILSIIFIFLMILMSLDVFEGNFGFWKTLLGFFMHNIPAIILSLLLILSWKDGFLASVGFFSGGIIYFSIILLNILKTGFSWYYLSWILSISFPALLIGFLYLIGRKNKDYTIKFLNKNRK